MPTSDRDPMTPLPTWSLLMGGPTPSALPNQLPLASPSAGWWWGLVLLAASGLPYWHSGTKRGSPCFMLTHNAHYMF